METLASYSIKELLPDIPSYGEPTVKKNFKLDDGTTFNVKINSQRLRIFKESTKCICCGIEGTIFALERHTKENPHINLYAVDRSGKLILMTKDHILPSSQSGNNTFRNLQTMCSVCNGLKGGFPITNEQLQEIRTKYLSLINGGMGHKKAFHIIEKMKTEMCNDKSKARSK